MQDYFQSELVKGDIIMIAYINTQDNKRVIKITTGQLSEEYRTKYLTIINLVKQGLLYKNI